MTVSLEIQQKVAEWRDKARAGTLTLDEMKSAISYLRAERMAMPPAKTKTKAVINTDDLFNELSNL